MNLEIRTEDSCKKRERTMRCECDCTRDGHVSTILLFALFVATHTHTGTHTGAYIVMGNTHGACSFLFAAWLAWKKQSVKCKLAAWPLPFPL